jgi:hypothetical protein
VLLVARIVPLPPRVPKVMMYDLEYMVSLQEQQQQEMLSTIE